MKFYKLISNSIIQFNEWGENTINQVFNIKIEGKYIFPSLSVCFVALCATLLIFEYLDEEEDFELLEQCLQGEYFGKIQNSYIRLVISDVNINKSTKNGTSITFDYNLINPPYEGNGTGSIKPHEYFFFTNKYVIDFNILVNNKPIEGELEMDYKSSIGYCGVRLKFNSGNLECKSKPVK